MENDGDRNERLPSYLQEDVPRTEYIYKPDPKIFNVSAATLSESLHLVGRIKRGNTYAPPVKPRGTLPKLNEKLNNKLKERALEIQRQSSDEESDRDGSISSLQNVAYLSRMYQKRVNLKHSKSLGALSDTRSVASMDSFQDSDLQSLDGCSVDTQDLFDHHISRGRRRHRKKNFLPGLPGQEKRRLKLKVEISLDQKIQTVSPFALAKLEKLEQDLKRTRNTGKYILANKRVPSNEELDWRREELFEKQYEKEENAQWRRQKLEETEKQRVLTEMIQREANRRRRTEVIRSFKTTFHVRKLIRAVLAMVYAEKLAKKPGPSKLEIFRHFLALRQGNEMRHRLLMKYHERQMKAQFQSVEGEEKEMEESMKAVAAAKFIAHWMVVKYRSFKRMKAANIILQTLEDFKYSSFHFTKMIRKYKTILLRIHNNVIFFHTSQDARLKAMLLWWDRTEERIRKEILEDQMSRKRAKRLRKPDEKDSFKTLKNKYNIDMNIKIQDHVKRSLLIEHISKMRLKHIQELEDLKLAKAVYSKKEAMKAMRSMHSLKEIAEEIGNHQNAVNKAPPIFKLFSGTTEEEMTSLVISGYIGVKEQQLARKKLLMNRKEVKDRQSTKKVILKTNQLLHKVNVTKNTKHRKEKSSPSY